MMTHVDKRAVELAVDALNATLSQDMDTAARLVGEASARPHGLLSALTAWCQIVVRVQIGDRPLPPGAIIMPIWRHPDTRRGQTADQVDAHTRWAGRLIAAWASHDGPAINALLLVPARDEVPEYLMKLLRVVAATIRQHGIRLVDTWPNRN